EAGPVTGERTRFGFAPARPRLELPFELDLPFEALDEAGELGPRQEAAAVGRERLNDLDHAVFGRENRLEDVRVVDIATPCRERLLRTERESAAALGVEQCREHGRRVQVRQAEPVDR